MRAKTDEAIVLHTRPLGERDLCVVLFLKEEGKRTGVARGAKRSLKRFGAALQTGSHIRLVYQESPRSDMLLLQEASALDRRVSWRASWRTIVVVHYALELVGRSLPEGQAADEKFILLRDFLFNLRPEASLLALLQFEFSWLSLCGWHPDLHACGICAKGWPGAELKQERFDHYWDHLFTRPLRSRRLLDVALYE